MNLEEFFTKHPVVAVAFSGGVDSAYLLYMACRYATKTKAYYVKSAFQPQFELDDAERLACGAGSAAQGRDQRDQDFIIRDEFGLLVYLPAE